MTQPTDEPQDTGLGASDTPPSLPEPVSFPIDPDLTPADPGEPSPTHRAGRQLSPDCGQPRWPGCRSAAPSALRPIRAGQPGLDLPAGTFPSHLRHQRLRRLRPGAVADGPDRAPTPAGLDLAAPVAHHPRRIGGWTTFHPGRQHRLPHPGRRTGYGHRLHRRHVGRRHPRRRHRDGPRPAVALGNRQGAHVMLALVVAVAGGCGAVTRYVADGAVQDRVLGPFPWGTTCVNMVGSLVLGVATGLVWYHGLASSAKSIVGYRLVRWSHHVVDGVVGVGPPDRERPVSPRRQHLRTRRTAGGLPVRRGRHRLGVALTLIGASTLNSRGPRAGSESGRTDGCPTPAGLLYTMY